jgi:Xaa-Pro aminopeptidase
MSRADRLVALLEERSLDWLLVTDLVNVRYLTGFTGTNGACLLSRDERLFLTDFRYVERARAEVHEFERVDGGRDLLGDMAARLSGRAATASSWWRQVASSSGCASRRTRTSSGRCAPRLRSPTPPTSRCASGA